MKTLRCIVSHLMHVLNTCMTILLNKILTFGVGYILCNISSMHSSNSEAEASELLECIEETRHCLIIENVFI